MTSLLLSVAVSALGLLDTSGLWRQPFEVKPAKAAVQFFVAPDCPISRAYAGEIRRICDSYRARGVDCWLVLVDKQMTDESAREHARQFGHHGYPVIVDREHRVVKAAGATVTPEAVVVGPGGQVAYRGRIDDSFLIRGQSRRTVSSPDLRNALDAVLNGKKAPPPGGNPVGCYIPQI